MCCMFSNRLGIGNLLEVMQEDEDSDDFDDADDAVTNNGDFERKADTAEDFSDINELAEDIQIAQVHIAIQLASAAASAQFRRETT